MDNWKGKGIVNYCESSDGSDDDDNNDGDSGNESENTEIGDDYNVNVNENNLRGDNHEHVGGVDYTKMTLEEIVSQEFGNLQEAESFYLEYGRQMGFSIRRHSFKKYKNGVPRLRIWVCQRQGFRDASGPLLLGRKRKPRPNFRSGCPALFHLSYDRSKSIWKVARFEAEHNHDMVKVEHVSFLRSHRKIDDSGLAEINALKSAGLKTCQVRNVFAKQAGGIDKMGFQERDLYNVVHRARSLHPPNGDIEGVLCYFNAKKEGDPGFFYKYNIGGDDTIGNIFWGDSVSRFDYHCFGDVIAFDSAYKRNRYNRPLVLVNGINHHHQTIIFACAIIVNETSDNYVWVLQQLLVCMGGKKPKSVVTDGDLSMRKAIREVLPEATHRLCSFHLQRNAAAHVKDPNFLTMFTRLMFMRCEIDEFKEEWVKLVNGFNLTENEWIKDTWESRSMWAESYLKGKFFGGTRTTSRCESMHSSFDKVVGRRLPFSEFVQRYDSMIALIRHKENRLDHESEYMNPIFRTPFCEYEFAASKMYTIASYSIFQEELNMSGAYKDYTPPICEDGMVTYFVSRYNSVSNFRLVEYIISDRNFTCSCQLMESTGIPCRHLLYVMRKEQFIGIPSSLTLKRWTKKAKSDMSNEFHTPGSVPTTFLHDIRYGQLCNAFRGLCSTASKREDTYVKVKQDITRSCKEVADMMSSNSVHQQPVQYGNIRDPTVSKRKANHGSKVVVERKCSICKQQGHRKNTCPSAHRVFTTSQEQVHRVESIVGSSRRGQVQHRFPIEHGCISGESTQSYRGCSQMSDGDDLSFFDSMDG